MTGSTRPRYRCAAVLVKSCSGLDVVRCSPQMRRRDDCGRRPPGGPPDSDCACRPPGGLPDSARAIVVLGVAACLAAGTPPVAPPNPSSGSSAAPPGADAAPLTSADSDVGEIKPPSAPKPVASVSAAPVTRRAPPEASVAGRGALDSAHVRLFADYPNAWLELRSDAKPGDWQKACAAPCDRRLVVDGMEARVVAPGMSPSNNFRIEPGTGTAWLRVSGGSKTTRTIGLIGLGAGIPLSLLGTGLLGYGSFKDNDGVRTAGIVTLAVGATSILAALPLLLSGATTVRDGHGRFVAHASDKRGGL